MTRDLPGQLLEITFSVNWHGEPHKIPPVLTFHKTKVDGGYEMKALPVGKGSTTWKVLLPLGKTVALGTATIWVGTDRGSMTGEDIGSVFIKRPINTSREPYDPLYPQHSDAGDYTGLTPKHTYP